MDSDEQCDPRPVRLFRHRVLAPQIAPPEPVANVEHHEQPDVGDERADQHVAVGPPDPQCDQHDSADQRELFRELGGADSVPQEIFQNMPFASPVIPVTVASAVQVYDHRDLPGLVETIRKTGGRHLVVGHSNTTPPLAELLTGDASTAINEEGEFDRLYVLTVGKNGEASSILMRYGEPYVPKPQQSE